LSQLSVGDEGLTNTTAHIYSSNSLRERGLRVYHFPNNGNYIYGIQSVIGYNSDGWKIHGLYAGAHRSTNTDGMYTYGVKAYAGRGSDGLNYAVMGKLVGDREGTGIFGCNSLYAEKTIDGDYAGYFRGDVVIEGNLEVDDGSSDIRLKKDIRTIEESVLDKLAQLQSIKFKLKHPSELEHPNDTSAIKEAEIGIDLERYNKDRIGLIAQELLATFPEVVREGHEGYLQVHYTQLIPILVKAVNEQQERIDKLESLLINAEKSQSIQGFNLSSDSDDSFEEGSAALQQNIPNPFSETTRISFNISEIRSQAMINVYDLQGQQKRTFQIKAPGTGEIVIPGSELSPGIYIYNLILDGKEIDSKRMILTE
jgi:hypothetical protein